MSRAADVVRLSGDEYDRLMDEREILRQEAARAWREVDFIAKERTEHLEWRTKLANDLDECERIRDVLGRTLNKRENDLMLLRNAVDAMMAPLGYHGTISARDDRVQAVMDALAHVDTAPAKQTSAQRPSSAVTRSGIGCNALLELMHEEPHAD